MMSNSTTALEPKVAAMSGSAPEPLLTEAQARERSREFRECCRQLQNPTPRTRCEAVRRLAAFGTLALEPLQRAVVDLEVEVQLAALQSLREIGGPGAVSLLMQAVRSDNAAVRLAAAEGLGELGGEEALEPLKSAYLHCYLGRSPQREQWIFPLMTLLCVAGSLFLFRAVVSGKFHDWGSVFPAVYGPLYWLVVYWVVMRSRRNARAIMGALLKVAERSPRAKLDALLPDLRVAAASRWMSDPGAREAARQAAERLRALSAALSDLPVPADVAPTSGRELPVPAALSGTTLLTEKELRS